MVLKNWKMILFWAAVACGAILFVNQVWATQVDECEQTFTYTKSSDYSDSRVNINFESNDNQIDVSAQSGYQVTEVALEVADDGHPGFHVYATGAVNNFNPNPGTDIQVAKVTVKKVCPTPTAQPTATPTLEPTPTDVVEPSVTPEPTEEVTPTPTEEVTPEPTREPTKAPPAEHHEDAVLSNNTTSTPGCSDLTPTMVQDVWYSDYKADTLNKGMYQLDLHWGLNSNYDRVNIAYGRNIGEWQHALLGTENDGTETIHGLQKGTYWFQVAYKNGCAVGAYSHPVDP